MELSRKELEQQITIQAQQIMDLHVSIHSMGKWIFIPTKRNWPKVGDRVLVLKQFMNRSRTILIAHVVNHNIKKCFVKDPLPIDKKLYGSLTLKNIIAWQPLPFFPKE